jgi:tRNA threonylcarbamoyladenosine biosynthesis protein TsaB
MNILGIDTSFISDTSIGLYFSDSENIEIKLKAPMSQEEKLLSAIDNGLSILQKKIGDIDLIAAGIGPGSFTGLRIGIATAQSLAWSLGKKLLGLPSLDLLAYSFPDCHNKDTLLVPLIDARMNRVFTALYTGGKKITPNLDIEPVDLKSRIAEMEFKKIILMGDGLIRYSEILRNIPGKEITFLPDYSISGLVICRQALKLFNENAAAAENKTLEPIYLRKSEAEAMLEKKSGLI